MSALDHEPFLSYATACLSWFWRIRFHNLRGFFRFLIKSWDWCCCCSWQFSWWEDMRNISWAIVMIIFERVLWSNSRWWGGLLTAEVIETLPTVFSTPAFWRWVHRPLGSPLMIVFCFYNILYWQAVMWSLPFNRLKAIWQRVWRKSDEHLRRLSLRFQGEAQ